MTQIQVIAVGAIPFCQLAIALNRKTENKQKSFKIMFFMTQIQVIAVGAIPFCQLAIALNRKTENKQEIF